MLRVKDKLHIMSCVYSERAFGKTPNYFSIKTFNKLGIKNISST
jgi:hypothetical protein